VVGADLDEPTLIGPGSEVSSRADLRPPCVVGSNCRIGADAVIERSVLLDGCVVERGAVVTNSILSGGVKVEEGAELIGAVIGEGELVGG
jgi:NDP-sugar pyrophosphorylase family protein